MGTKDKFLILIMFLLPAAAFAQEKLDYANVDSLTNIYYKTGEWNKLIRLGKDATNSGIDFKFLRQRIGFAYYSLGNFVDAKFQFEKAMSFDKYDPFSLEYLYFSYLNTGKEDYAGILAERLSKELSESLLIRQFQIIQSIELEYNYKYAITSLRSDPKYYRLGIQSKLGYRLMLYQSYSDYKQEIIRPRRGDTGILSETQPEYFALLNWAVSSKLLVKFAYHYLNVKVGTSNTTGNLFRLAVAKDIERFSFETSGSALSINQQLIYQTDFQTGYIFPGRSNVYLTSAVSEIFQQNDNRLVFNQKAGLKVIKNIWIEGNVTLGRMPYYNDYNGLYVYNSYDPMVFRTGATIICYLGKNISLWANFSYEQKEYLNMSSLHYDQYSYLGGVKWKF